MSRALNDLDLRFKPLAMELIARCSEVGCPVQIIFTLRTKEEQDKLIAEGRSWTRNSKHLPQTPSGQSLAIDICPYHEFDLYGPDKLQWDANAEVWQLIGRIGEGLGLRWGGRFGPPAKPDMGHFEMRIK